MRRLQGLTSALLIFAALASPSGATELRNIFVTDKSSNETMRVTNGGGDVNIQDQFTRAVDLRFSQQIGASTTLSVATVVGATVLTLTSVAGFTAGTYIEIDDSAGGFYFGTQIGAPAGNVITVDSLLDQVYAAGSVVEPRTFDMAVDGSITPQVFTVGPMGGGVSIDITRVLGSILDATAMDDGLFGALPALTNGCVLRLTDGVSTNLWNVKTNGDLSLLGFDFMYVDKAPAGLNGARYRISYGGQSKHGVTLRLAPGDMLEYIIQDDLTGLDGYNKMAQGHVVE